MLISGRRTHVRGRGLASLLASLLALPAAAQSVSALPDQTSRIRLSNHDVNHIVCVGGEIDDVKFSAEKGLAVERGGSDAWIKFLVQETDDAGQKTRIHVTAPSEFFVSCNGAIYPLYAEPSDVPAQTVKLAPGATQRARANEALLSPLVEEERAVGIALAILQDRVPASFSDVAPNKDRLTLRELAGVVLTERHRLEVDGAGLSASEYAVQADHAMTVEERDFLDRALGTDIFSVTLDRLAISPTEPARLIVIRRSIQP